MLAVAVVCLVKRISSGGMKMGEKAQKQPGSGEVGQASVMVIKDGGKGQRHILEEEKEP